MSFIGQEMALPMEQIIGGPLQAIIKAQSMAASTTANFIKTVGLNTTDGGKTYVARTVDFSFNRKKPQADGSVINETVDLSVPLLTIVPVPYIRVQQAVIDFQCTVSSSTIDTSKTSFGLDVSASGGFFGVDFSVSASYSTESTRKSEVTRTATLKVQVTAVQDQIPAGLAKVLDILQTAVSDSKAA